MNRESLSPESVKQTIFWSWTDGILSTFLSGLFAILPIAITVAIIGWVVRHLQDLLGPRSSVGRTLESVGLNFATDKLTAQIIGWVLVLTAIWLLGVLTKSMARSRIVRVFETAVNSIPVVKGIYRTSTQLVRILRKDDSRELKAMSVVFCTLGDTPGGGILALMASPEIYRFNDRDYRVVYVPTAPVPMTGYVLFVPVDRLTSIDMSAEQMMRIYFSLGILTPQVLPDLHRVTDAAGVVRSDIPAPVGHPRP